MLCMSYILQLSVDFDTMKTCTHPLVVANFNHTFDYLCLKLSIRNIVINLEASN